MLLIRTRECAGGATPTFKNVPSQILKTKCWESEVTSKEKDGSWQSQKKPLPVVTTEPCNIAFFWRWQCLPGGDATGLPGLLERERGATVETCNQSRIWSQCKPRLRRSPMPVYRSWMQHQEYQPQYARLRFLYLPVSLSSWSLDLPLDGSGVFGGESLWNPSMVTGATQVTLHKFAVLAAAPSVFQDVSSWRGHEWSRNHQKHLIKQVRICIVYVVRISL